MFDKFKDLNTNIKLGLISFILGFIALCLIIAGQSFAIFSGTFTDTNEQVVKLGNLEVIMKEPSTGIDLGLSSMSDVEGLLQEEVYTFTVENSGSANAKYKVLIIDDETSKASYTGTLLDKSLIKLGLEINGKEIGPLTLSELDDLLNEKELKSGKKDTYKLRLWIDESVTLSDDAQNKTFTSKIVVNAQPSNYSPKDAWYDTLHDAILANEYQTTPEKAIEKINAKGEPDLSKTAPAAENDLSDKGLYKSIDDVEKAFKAAVENAVDERIKASATNPKGTKQKMENKDPFIEGLGL